MAMPTPSLTATRSGQTAQIRTSKVPIKFSVQAISDRPLAADSSSARPTKIALAVAAVMIVAIGLGLHFRNRQDKPNDFEPPASTGSVGASVPTLKSETSGAWDDLASAHSQPARLEIEIEHHFVIARATVWMDNNLVYQKELQGSKTKHALVLQRTLGFDAGTVKLPAGPHTVKVRVQSGIDSYDLTKTVSATLVSGRQSTLRVTCDRQPNLLQVALR